jgi:hypothetical protein
LVYAPIAQLVERSICNADVACSNHAGGTRFQSNQGTVMKTSATFKLSKTAKRALAIIVNADQHGAWKKALIGAEAAAQVRPSRREKTK